MPFTNQTLIFESHGLDSDTLLIKTLEGSEQISGLYRFELELVSENGTLDLAKILAAPAKIGLKARVAVQSGEKGWTTHWINGELESFAQTSQGQGWTGYHAVLVPRLARLQANFRSRVFMGKSALEIAKSLLVESGLQDGQEFELAKSVQDALKAGEPKDRASYPQREYVVQYEESDFAFVSRWLEHEGIFYVFDQDDPDVEKVLLCDGVSSYTPVRVRREFPFKPQRASSGGDTQDSERDSAITRLECRVSQLPKQVVLNDYNWRSPESAMRCTEPVSEGGRGTQYEYNYHYKTSAQGHALAKVVAQGLICRGQVFSGTSSCRNLRAGFTFELTDHPRHDFNQEYLLTRVQHSATQQISLETRSMTGGTYDCTFEAIPASVTFRPEADTPWPAIRGVINAQIDGTEDDQKYAELDEQGRYKVKIPFDVDGGTVEGDFNKREKGAGSRYMRLATPYAGPDEGMHFALRPGTEVLLTHIDGDPDRPVIAGAVPNPTTASVVDASNQTENKIRSSKGNFLSFQDEEGREGISLGTASGSVYQVFRRPGALGGTGGVHRGSGSGGAAGAGRRTPKGLPGAGSGMPNPVADARAAAQEAQAAALAAQTAADSATETERAAAEAELARAKAEEARAKAELLRVEAEEERAAKAAEEALPEGTNVSEKDAWSLDDGGRTDPWEFMQLTGWRDQVARDDFKYAKSEKDVADAYEAIFPCWDRGADPDASPGGGAAATVWDGIASQMSALAGYVGYVELNAGPMMTVGFGELGDWKEGDNSRSIHKFDEIQEKKIANKFTEDFSPPVDVTSTTKTANVGTEENRWGEVMEYTHCMKYDGEIHADGGEVSNLQKGSKVYDRLVATTWVQFLLAAPIVMEYDFGALHSELHTGVRLDVSVGSSTSIAIGSATTLSIHEWGYKIFEGTTRVSKKAADLEKEEKTVKVAETVVKKNASVGKAKQAFLFKVEKAGTVTRSVAKEELKAKTIEVKAVEQKTIVRSKTCKALQIEEKAADYKNRSRSLSLGI